MQRLSDTSIIIVHTILAAVVSGELSDAVSCLIEVAAQTQCLQRSSKQLIALSDHPPMQSAYLDGASSYMHMAMTYFTSEHVRPLHLT